MIVGRRIANRHQELTSFVNLKLSLEDYQLLVNYCARKTITSLTCPSGAGSSKKRQMHLDDGLGCAEEARAWDPSFPYCVPVHYDGHSIER